MGTESRSIASGDAFQQEQFLTACLFIDISLVRPVALARNLCGDLVP
jgi:hypothetical protein